MKPLALESPLARRFAEALVRVDPVRARIHIDVYATAFLAAEPGLTTSPERRPRLAGAIQELVEAGVLKASRTVDRSELPHLPRFVVLQNRATDVSVRKEAATYPWRPELAWAAQTVRGRSEFDALQAVQRFLRERGSWAPVVPTGERSLELFGDEKRLDALRRGRLFGPGRLTLDLLRARAFAPPFAFRRVGSGPVALVLENVATYRSVLSSLPSDSPVGMVIFGGGGNFAQSVLYMLELTEASSIQQIRYFGDLDCRGLQIPKLAHAAAHKFGLPAVRPAIGLWAKLLRVGHRERHESVDQETAGHLVAWLPATLRAAASQVLTSGMRLAQEAVGTEALGQDSLWATWAGLGAAGVPNVGETEANLRRPYRMSRSASTVVTDDSALIRDDAGERQEPTDDSAWLHWVAAGRTRNRILGDPILDWLELYGRSTGFLPDDQRAAYDVRADFQRFVLEKGRQFEAAAIDLLARRCHLVRIANCRHDSRSLQRARETLDALRAGVPIVAQGVLRNPNRQTYGVADLLVRSDILAAWFPELLSAEEASIGAPLLGQPTFHYRTVDIKFHTFDLTRDGHVSTSRVQLAYAVQVWIYTEALGRIQGFTPPAGYLMGRTWKYGDQIGEGCVDRLARVDMDRWLPNRDAAIYDVAQEAVSWIRRLRNDGANWRVLPLPSVAELYPHARNTEDAPWHAAKKEICTALGELTLLPGMNPERRALAHAIGIKRCDDPNASAARLGITSPVYAARAEAVLAANRSLEPTVIPERIQASSEWREVPPIEFYVDFETVSNLDDDFTQLPRIGGCPQIVQIGCGFISSEGTWTFKQWTADALNAAEERRIIDAWVAELIATCDACGISLANVRLCHWSAAEPINLETAYNAARKRHPDACWPTELPWFDVLERLIRAEPVAVTGAFNFSLKSIAKAMHEAGRITATWMDGPTDGLGAMVAIWSAAREVANTNDRLSLHPLALEVGRYNEVDCRAMCEIVAWLRANR